MCYNIKKPDAVDDNCSESSTAAQHETATGSLDTVSGCGGFKPHGMRCVSIMDSDIHNTKLCVQSRVHVGLLQVLLQLAKHTASHPLTSPEWPYVHIHSTWLPPL
jgi:hypothetical protein